MSSDIHSVFECSDEVTRLLAEIYYRRLVSRKPVSYRDVYMDYLQQTDVAKYENFKKYDMVISNEPVYKKIKNKVGKQVRDEFEEIGYCIESVKDDENGQKSVFLYKGEDDNPLSIILMHAKYRSIEQIVRNCMETGFAVNLSYQPFGKPEHKQVFHPHIIRKFNGRTFFIGVSEREDKNEEPIRKNVLSLDRIVDARRSHKRCLSQEKGEYDYLHHIVGVSPTDKPLQTIRVRLHDKHAMGRIEKKPLHHSQKTVIAFAAKREDGLGYGEIQLEVQPNVELRSLFLSYGSSLEVIEPADFRDEMIDILKRTLSRYGKS